MKHLLSPFFFGIVSLASAQPTLTFTGNAPQPGGSYEWNFGDYVAPGSGGAGQVWDFSQLTSDSTALINLVDPDNTPLGALFPAATVAEVSVGSTVYFRAASDGVFLLGYVAEGSPVVFSEEGRFMTFPCSHQTTWSDTYSASLEEEGLEIQIGGDITGTVDGYGTVLLPNGSVPNVLRVHWVQEEVTTMDMFTFTTVFDNHLYFVPSLSNPLVQTVSATSSFLGNTTTTEFTQWVNDFSTGAPDVPARTNPINLFPVPTQGELYFTLPAHFSGTPLVTITDATGRTVRGVENLRTNGTQGSVDVSALPAGVYQFIATDELGQRATARFTVE